MCVVRGKTILQCLVTESWLKNEVKEAAVFIDRNRELAALEREYARDQASFVVV